MKAHLVAALVAAAWASSACVDSASSSTAQPTAVLAVVAYGDSTQRALGTPHASDRPGWSIENRGVSGSTAGQLLEGKDGQNRTWAEEMADSRADLVIINHALNISGGTTSKQYELHLVGLVAMAQAAGKQVMLEGPNQAAPHGAFDLPAFAERIQIMRSVAQRYSASYCEQPNVPLMDGAHPTAEGYALKAARLAECIGNVAIRGN